jgi:hypothetical protein
MQKKRKRNHDKKYASINSNCVVSQQLYKVVAERSIFLAATIIY